MTSITLMMRAKLDDAAVAEYAERYRYEVERGLKESSFPPCVVFETPKGLMLAHGWHRFAAMGMARVKEATFEVRAGTLADAAEFAARVNTESTSVRYTTADKRNAVARLLAILGNDVSSRRVAELCGVDHKTVERWRAPSPEPRKGRDGRARAPRRGATEARGLPRAPALVETPRGRGTPKETDAVGERIKPVVRTVPQVEGHDGAERVEEARMASGVLAVGAADSSFVVNGQGHRFEVRIGRVLDRDDAPVAGAATVEVSVGLVH